MCRRHWTTVAAVVLIAVLPLGALASCGDDPGRGTAPTEPTEIPRPSDPDVALVWVGDPDGFPSVVIGADGWVYAPDEGSSADSRRAQARMTIRPLATGSVAAQAPTPPEPTPVSRRMLTAEGVQTVLDLANQLHLLQEPGIYEDPGVTDHGTTYVTLQDGAGTYIHAAYALGYDDEHGNRRDLQEFVESIEDFEALEELVGADNLGPPERYVPVIFHVSVTESYLADADTTWPTGTPVSEGCVELPVELFTDGAPGVYIADIEGEQVRVTVVPDLPGGPCV